MDARNRPPYLQRTIREGYIILVDAVDTTWTNGGAFAGDGALPDQLADVHVGTVPVRRPVDPAISPSERPWQAGRVHLDGVRREERTWPREEFVVFRDHGARRMTTATAAPGTPVQ